MPVAFKSTVNGVCKGAMVRHSNTVTEVRVNVTHFFQFSKDNNNTACYSLVLVTVINATCYVAYQQVAPLNECVMVKYYKIV